MSIARSTALLALAASSLALVGCADAKKLADEELKTDGYDEITLAEVEDQRNVFQVTAKRDDKPCEGTIKVIMGIGGSQASFDLHIKCEGDEPPPRKIVDPNAELEKGCEGGDQAVCAKLASALVEQKRDLERARKIARKACDAGRQDACNQLGLMLLRELGGPKDEAAARDVFTKACEAKHIKSCADLGRAYYISQAYKSAKKYFEQACEAGEPTGCNGVGMMLREGTGGKQDDKEARKLFDNACQQGLSEACVNLAEMLLYGLGGPENPARAKRLYTELCEAGEPVACEKLKRIP